MNKEKKKKTKSNKKTGMVFKSMTVIYAGK